MKDAHLRFFSITHHERVKRAVKRSDERGKRWVMW